VAADVDLRERYEYGGPVLALVLMVMAAMAACASPWRARRAASPEAPPEPRPYAGRLVFGLVVLGLGLRWRPPATRRDWSSVAAPKETCCRCGCAGASWCRRWARPVAAVAWRGGAGPARAWVFRAAAPSRSARSCGTAGCWTATSSICRRTGARKERLRRLLPAAPWPQEPVVVGTCSGAAELLSKNQIYDHRPGGRRTRPCSRRTPHGQDEGLLPAAPRAARLHRLRAQPRRPAARAPAAEARAACRSSTTPTNNSPSPSSSSDGRLPSLREGPTPAEGVGRSGVRDEAAGSPIERRPTAFAAWPCPFRPSPDLAVARRPLRLRERWGPLRPLRHRHERSGPRPPRRRRGRPRPPPGTAPPSRSAARVRQHQAPHPAARPSSPACAAVMW